MPEIEIKSFLISDLDLQTQTWWPALHQMIIESFQQKPHNVFPRHWTRLNPEPEQGAKDLVTELNPDAFATIIFTNDKPVAFGAVSPSMTEQSSTWALHCICVHPSARGQNLSTTLLHTLIEQVQITGGTTITSTYCPKETGSFWRAQGFEDVPGSESVLPVGFKPGNRPAEEEGLKEEIVFRTGVLEL